MLNKKILNQEDSKILTWPKVYYLYLAALNKPTLLKHTYMSFFALRSALCKAGAEILGYL